MIMEIAPVRTGIEIIRKDIMIMDHLNGIFWKNYHQ